MSWDTLRSNKLRSALTVLGIVIGITSIVGITSLVRGVDESIKSLLRQGGPDTIMVAQFSGLSMMSGLTFQEILKRPSLTPADAEALEQLPSVLMTDVMVGGGMETRMERVFFRNQRTSPMAVI